MYYCVAYDVSSARLRRRIVKWCKQAGLRRMQKSVFTGPVPDKQLADLQQNIKAELSPQDRFFIIPLDKHTLQNIALYGDEASQFLWQAKPLFQYF